MINTELHNELIEKQILVKLTQADHINEKAKREVLKEKLKSILMIMFVIFIALFLLILLYWLFPSSSDNEHITMEKVEKLIEKSTCQCNNQKISLQESNTNATNNQNNASKINTKTNKRILKNGIEYVKFNNHVYKRFWEKGELVKEQKLEETIDKSRKIQKEKIPQLATPKKELKLSQ